MTRPNDPVYPIHAAKMEYERFLNKRELFAAMAMQCHIAQAGTTADGRAKFATQCVQLADALLAELAKPGAT